MSIEGFALEILRELAYYHIKPKCNRRKATSLEHIAWMCTQLTDMPTGPKRDRWIGFIQAGLIANQISTLYDERQRIKDHLGG